MLNFPGLETLTTWLEHTIEFIHPGQFNLTVALSSTILALLAIFLSWLVYGRKPMATGEKDPLKKMFGPIFAILENKYWVDEGYWAVFVDRYIDLSRFFAQTIDWRFWHDWVHESVIANNFKRLTRFLANPVDLGIVDRLISRWPADFTQWLSKKLRPIQNGFVRSYALSVLLGVVLILGYLLLK